MDRVAKQGRAAEDGNPRPARVRRERRRMYRGVRNADQRKPAGPIAWSRQRDRQSVDSVRRRE